jgi:hypothetical protein
MMILTVVVTSQIALHKLIITVCNSSRCFCNLAIIFLRLLQNATLVVHFGPKLKKKPILEISSTTSVRVSRMTYCGRKLLSTRITKLHAVKTSLRAIVTDLMQLASKQDWARFNRRNV